MIATLLLLGLTTVAAVTDVLWQKIYNLTTYSGIVAALVLAAARSLVETSGDTSVPVLLSRVTIGDSVVGFLVCGVLLLLCFVLFRIGGGDVKLLAMVGAFLGLELGLEALLWTFVLGGMLALVQLIVRVGAIRLVVKCVQQLTGFLRRGVRPPLEAADQQALKSRLYLGPCALLAVVIVCFDLVGYLPRWE